MKKNLIFVLIFVIYVLVNVKILVIYKKKVLWKVRYGENVLCKIFF